MPLAIPARNASAAHERLIQFVVALVATAAVGLAAALLVAVFLPAGAAPPPKNPFGMGLREAGPCASALGRAILGYQASFNRALEAALGAVARSGGSSWPLIGLGFAYGAFHAAGPGHGKGIISAYLVANERALRRGFAIGLAAALLQGAVAIGAVGVGAILLRATAATLTRSTELIETASFVAVTLIGLLLVWRKAGRVAKLLSGAAAGPACDGVTCGHAHMPGPASLGRRNGWEVAAVIAAAGSRPCAGAILLLVFALSQGVFAAGVAAVFAMSLGTALATGVIAALAVFAKRIALRLAGGESRGGLLAVAGLELATASFVAVLGVSLLLGLSAGIAAG